LWKRYVPVLQRARYMLADPGEMVDEVTNALARLLGGDGAAFTDTIYSLVFLESRWSFGLHCYGVVSFDTGICWDAIHELTHHCARGRKRV